MRLWVAASHSSAVSRIAVRTRIATRASSTPSQKQLAASACYILHALDIIRSPQKARWTAYLRDEALHVTSR